MLKTVILRQKEELERLISNIEKSLSVAPEGTLRIAHNGNRMQYYHRKTPQDVKGIYIPKEKLSLARALAQKDYESRLLKQAKEKLSDINSSLTKLSNSSLTDVFENMNEYRKKLVKPHVLTEEEYVKEWLEKPYAGKSFSEIDPCFYTRRGERVRSKAEIIIADMLADMRVPYKYECPVFLKGDEVRYPDFTILLPHTREIKYLEHCGMMDDEKYLNGFFGKMSIYNRNGIILSRNLFMTFESKNHVLDTRELKRVIESIIKSDCV